MLALWLFLLNLRVIILKIYNFLLDKRVQNACHVISKKIELLMEKILNVIVWNNILMMELMINVFHAFILAYHVQSIIYK